MIGDFELSGCKIKFGLPGTVKGISATVAAVIKAISAKEIINSSRYITDL